MDMSYQKSQIELLVDLLPPVNASRSKSDMAPKRAASAVTRGASEERPEKARPVKRGSFNKPGGLDGCFQESHIQRIEQMK